MRKKFSNLGWLGLFLVLMCLGATTALASGAEKHHHADEWSLVTDEPGWSPRAGLQVVELRNKFYLMGGRTPVDPAINPVPGASTMYSDVWKSRDKGQTWTQIRESDSPEVWPARAYFQAVTMRGRMFVLGGQNFELIANPDPGGPPFLPNSQFFNDVWSSRNGVDWTQLTAEAPWAGRAGLSAVVFRNEIYVMGGSFNDDPAIIGGPPTRVYFNDVWKSADGANWELMTEEAPWAPRAGGVAVVKGGYLYLVGGEDGFTCLPGLPCPPYYNDVWRTRNGADWELVTDEAAWAARPGHQCLVYKNYFVLFGGFGLSFDPDDPFAPSNPMDVWVSRDGAEWTMVSDSPWNAEDPADIKYDFDALVSRGGRFGFGSAIYTFGGDRETFNFADPLNYLNVDDDVWRFRPKWWRWGWFCDDKAGTDNVTATGVADLRAYPNPFNPRTTISFSLLGPERVNLAIYDIAGHRVRTLLGGSDLPAGNHEAVWNGKNQQGQSVPAGVYFYRLDAGEYTAAKRIMLVK